MNLEWLIYLDKEGKDGTNSMLKTYFNISGVVTTQRPSVGKKDMSPITLEKKGILNISWDHGCMWILPDPSRSFQMFWSTSQPLPYFPSLSPTATLCQSSKATPGNSKANIIGIQSPEVYNHLLYLLCFSLLPQHWQFPSIGLFVILSRWCGSWKEIL